MDDLALCSSHYMYCILMEEENHRELKVTWVTWKSTVKMVVVVN